MPPTQAQRQLWKDAEKAYVEYDDGDGPTILELADTHSVSDETIRTWLKAWRFRIEHGSAAADALGVTLAGRRQHDVEKARRVAMREQILSEPLG